MNDKRRKNRLWHAAVIPVIAAACLLSVGVGNYLVNYAIAEIRAGYDL